MREFRGWAKEAVASPFSVKYCFKRFLSKINAGINIVGNCTSPLFWIFWSPTPLSSEGIKGVKNHVVMKLIVDHSPLLSNVSCCVLSALFLCPEKIYCFPLWLPSIKASMSFSSLGFFHWAIGVYQKHGLLVFAKLMFGAIRKSCHFMTN